MKNEGSFLQEWADIHLHVGVDRIYIYDNESEIPVTVTLDEYIKGGKVTVELLPSRKQQIPYCNKCL